MARLFLHVSKGTLSWKADDAGGVLLKNVVMPSNLLSSVVCRFAHSFGGAKIYQVRGLETEGAGGVHTLRFLYVVVVTAPSHLRAGRTWSNSRRSAF